MQLISEVTVGSGGAASITFSAIPADYTDLYLVGSQRNQQTSGDTSGYGLVKLNSTNGSARYLLGTGSSVSSFSDTKAYAYVNNASSTASTFSNWSLYIPNYLSSVAKSGSFDTVWENNATASRQTIVAALWSVTTAVTSLSVTGMDSGGSEIPLILEGSTFYLYGITAGSDGIVAVS